MQDYLILFRVPKVLNCCSLSWKTFFLLSLYWREWNPFRKHKGGLIVAIALIKTRGFGGFAFGRSQGAAFSSKTRVALKTILQLRCEEHFCRKSTRHISTKKRLPTENVWIWTVAISMLKHFPPYAIRYHQKRGCGLKILAILRPGLYLVKHF